MKLVNVVFAVLMVPAMLGYLYCGSALSEAYR